MFRRLLCIALLSIAPVAAAVEFDTVHELEEVIFIPFNGTWTDGQNTLTFAHGDYRDENGWIFGNVIGGDGVQSRYLWKSTGPTTGQFYFDMSTGRQGPIYVTFVNATRMKWIFGTRNIIMDKVN